MPRESRFTNVSQKFSMTQQEIEDALIEMERDSAYNTESGYSPNLTLHPDNVMSFKDKHLAYLKMHKTTDPNQYLSNLRLMTKIR